MKFDVLTIFPEAFEGVLNFSMLKKAREKGLIDVDVTNIRDFAEGRHRVTDDSPYGGDEGMVMKVEPIAGALNKVKTDKTKVLLMSASGKQLTQEKLLEYSRLEHVAIICGRYEGVDERVLNSVDEEISIGDYVLSGGEFAALVVIEGIMRLIPGALGNEASSKNESFSSGILDFPQYTRPAEFSGQKVPEVLLNGNHENIRKFRRQEALRKTLKNRPSLLDTAELTAEDKKFLESIKKENE